MATTKSAKYPYKWPDGTYHSIPASQRGAAKPGEIKISTPNGFIPVSEWDFGNGKGVTTPQAAAPAAPAEAEAEGSMGPLPLPPDAAWDDETAGLKKGLIDDQTSITGDRTRGLLDYGFNEDPTSKALSFDPNNPFSRAALLKKNYDRSRASTGLNMGARGQLYAGAYQTAQDNINQGQLGAEDTLQKSLIGFLAHNSNAYRQAGTNYEINSARADGSRAGRANTNPLYSPTAKAAAKPAAAAAPGSGPGGAAIGATAGGTTNPNTAGGGSLTPRTLAPVLPSLAAGPGIKGTKRKRKGNTVTYTASTKGP